MMYVQVGVLKTLKMSPIDTCWVLEKIPLASYVPEELFSAFV